jgi:hypothetical protein
MGCFGFHCASCDLPILSEGPDSHDCCFKCEEPFSTNERGGGCVSESHLLTLDGSNFHEPKYGSYGVFGEKDAHAWLAQNNIEAVREWRNDPEWEPSGDNEDDRGEGIDLVHGRREKTHEEIRMMILDGITITKKNIYHYARDLIKNPLRIVCDTCFTGEGQSWHSPTDTYDKCDNHSRDHSNQSWTSATDTDVGWVCQDCGGY